MMKYLKIYYRLLVYLTSFTVCSGAIKNALKMTRQLVFFRAFLFIPDPKSEKKFPVNQLIKNSGHITYQAKTIMANLYKCREK